jgi:pimeloyl-ACP methyl ester carboxylesterase
MPELATGAVTLHYEIAGQGPPLILIPGLLSDSASWAPLVPLLQNRFTVILPDPRGAGRSTLDAPFDTDAMATDLRMLADNLDLARFAVAGHSFGGRTALALAHQAPERLTGLATLATGPEPSARTLAVFRTLADQRAAGGDWLRGLFPWLFADPFFDDPAAVTAAVQASLAYPHAQTLEAMRHQIEGYAQTGGAPAAPPGVAVHALLAENDALVPFAPALAAWKARGAVVDALAGAGHALHWDRPQATADWLTRVFAP